MSLDDMNYNIAQRQIKRQSYQQKYFIRKRQLDTIQLQATQLQEAIKQAEEQHNSPLLKRLQNALSGLIKKWNSIRREVN